MRDLTHDSRTYRRLPGVDYVLIDRALAGDEEAFWALYGTQIPRVCATVARFVRNWDEAEDLVQVVFIRAFQGLVGFRRQSAFSTWVTRIALNVCTTYLRRKRARRNWLDEMHRHWSGPPNGWGPTPYEDPEEAMARKERRELVMRGIRALPEHHQEAIWLRYMKERSYREITEELQVPMGTVKIRLHRARNQLRGEFERMGIGV